MQYFAPTAATTISVEASAVDGDTRFVYLHVNTTNEITWSTPAHLSYDTSSPTNTPVTIIYHSAPQSSNVVGRVIGYE